MKNFAINEKLFLQMKNLQLTKNYFFNMKINLQPNQNLLLLLIIYYKSYKLPPQSKNIMQ